MRAATRCTAGFRARLPSSLRRAHPGTGTYACSVTPPTLQDTRYRSEQPWQHTSRRTLFVEAAEGLEAVMRGVQSGLIDVHTFTQLPWWATFACSTVLVRVALLPLARLQIIESRKFASAMPEVSFLAQLLRERLRGIGNSTSSGQAGLKLPVYSNSQENKHDGHGGKGKAAQISEYMQTLSVFRKGAKASFLLNNVSFKKMLGLTTANISVFATFVFSVRDLIQDGTAEGLDTGGMLWFADLTVKDPMLAVLAVGASYSAIMISLGANARPLPPAAAPVAATGAGRGEASRPPAIGGLAMHMHPPASPPPAAAAAGTAPGANSTLLFFTDVAGTLIICLIPMVLNLPAGVFCYWIPSSMAGAAQSLLLRSPQGLKFLRLPPLLPPAANNAASIARKHAPTTSAAPV